MLRHYAILLACLLSSASTIGVSSGSTTNLESVRYSYSITEDLPTQQAALLQLLSSFGDSLLTQPSAQLSLAGLPGSYPWNTPNVSYCNWWGVACCGITLTEVLKLCDHGRNSINALQLGGTQLNGTLPDVFAAFPDLQQLYLSGNPGK
jgi:hypothetical protein